MSKDIYTDVYGRNHIISKILSSGGQGVVYKTEDDTILLKLEWNGETKEIIKDTSNNTKFDKIRTLPFIEKTNIILPQATLKDISGYTMKLLDDMSSFKDVFSKEAKEDFPNNKWLDYMINKNADVGNLLKNYLASGGIKKRLKSYLEAACILAKIHSSGLVYCDISDNNMFVSSSPDKSNVWFIDSDNLDYMTNTITKNWFTGSFVAPEVFNGKGNTMYSDSFSFAISLFWNLTMFHPFVGKALEKAIEDDFLDGSMEEIACQKDFSWILDTDDDSNINDSGMHEMFVNDELIKYFHKTFSKIGRQDRQLRTTMPEWAYVLAKELDKIITCNNCYMDYYSDKSIKCPWCEENTIELIFIKSFKEIQNNKKLQWNFVKEIDKDYINVPLRLLEGFKSENINESAFKLKINENKIEITEISYKYDFYIINNNSEKSIYGNTKIEFKNKLEISAICKDNNINCFIEIEVKK